MELTSPFEGVLKEILVPEGEVAKVGQGLCVIETEEDHPDEVPVAQDAQPSPSMLGEKPSQRGVESSSSHPSKQSRRPHPLDPSPTQVASREQQNTLAAPSVRHFARSQGITNLSSLHPGSGKDGRIEKQDVEHWLRKASSPPEGVQNLSLAPGGPEGRDSDETTVEIGRTRWAMWRAMEKSLEIPHFGYGCHSVTLMRMDANGLFLRYSTVFDLTPLSELLPVLNKHIPASYKEQDVQKFAPAVNPLSIFPARLSNDTKDPLMTYDRLTFLPLLLKALSRAMQEWPLFRSNINFPQANQKPSLTIRPHSDIAIALSTPSGLYTPVLESVDTKTTYQLMGELRRLQSLGRTVPHGLTVKDMPRRGATITVSNVGAIGQGHFASPLLVPGGGVAIVAIGRARWVGGDRSRRLEVGVSWSADHRVVEGAELAAFTETWRSWVEEPGRMNGDGR